MSDGPTSKFGSTSDSTAFHTSRCMKKVTPASGANHALAQESMEKTSERGAGGGKRAVIKNVEFIWISRKKLWLKVGVNQELLGPVPGQERR